MRDENINELLKIIEENGFATVKQLAGITYTSESTIRRRLNAMENMGLVKRSYGGAELAKSNINIPVELRLKKNHKAKEIIGKKAAEFVKNNSIIFIDASSTCLHMAPYLSEKRGLTVYTYGTELCCILANFGISVVCLGGNYDKMSKTFTGEYAINMAKSIYYDAFFFSSSAYCEEIVYDYSEAEAHLRREILKNSQKSYFLCDKEKFEKRSNYIICNKSQISEIITE